jgi:hypothetical protein
MALGPSALGCTHIAALGRFTGEERTRRGESREQNYGSAAEGEKQWKAGQRFCRKSSPDNSTSRRMERTKHGPRVSRAWTGCHPAVGVSEENLAAAGSNHLKTDSSKSAHGLLASEPRETSDTEICWMPASSSGVDFWGSSSRHNSTTSCTRFMSLSRFLAWV